MAALGGGRLARQSGLGWRPKRLLGSVSLAAASPPRSACARARALAAKRVLRDEESLAVSAAAAAAAGVGHVCV
jgi:hypothetical protein